ncbi:MAG: bifunctional methionine sulfoxide reductase B/A protein [Sphaerochaeta associata]|uniref:bifunctional methionine sulfoxide reductase B/A protein n=1 Tax=Sphaerochaeta associata TaxID=1129264 RepID=UPI002B20109F|nr:bifunctional methionine sulfoxide reductase B/A protein [Sphaerochaeta associata]MEA5027909.1 bifunctional methionine sulfoxide reductase B/A protein [Sphaerochaeta associata]
MSRYLVLLIIILILAVIIVIIRPKAQAQPLIEETMATTQQRFTFQPLDQSLRNTLNAQESQVIINKGTERAFTGAYTDTEEEGTYYCRWCNSPLYSSQSKFHSGCGWPSFDDEIPNAVLRYPDADGSRTEIVCATCQGHLGHVFTGERFTEKNTRHCVNSISLVFRQETPVAEAVFAGGCFWGVEHLFEQKKGVYSAVSGYTGGTLADPTYQDVLTHTSGHLEAVKVYYNPLEVSYEDLAKFFFEIHDPTQTDGQGPDIGNQYLSAIFYRSRSEFDTAVRLIEILEAKGLKIATTLRGAAIFYPAEEYHQDYYVRKGSQPYCHAWVKRF